MKKSLDLLLEYEKIHNFKYDVIIKIRPDLSVNNYINLRNLNLKKIYFDKNTSNSYQKSDKLIVAGRDIYINFLKDLEKYKKNIGI